MADTTTTLLDLIIQTIGGNDNSWGQKLNSNFENIEFKMADVTAKSTTGGTTTLTTAEVIAQAIVMSGTLVSGATVDFVSHPGFWWVRNATAGDYTLTLTNGGTTVTVDQGTSRFVWSDGTDFYAAAAAVGLEDSQTAEVAVVSAATCNVLGADSFFIEVTGSTGPITSFGTGANRLRRVRFASTPTINHNATSLIIPGGANLTAAVGDVWLIGSDASSNVRVIAITKADGTPVALPASGSIATFTAATLMTIGAASSGRLSIKATVSPAQITSNQDNYAGATGIWNKITLDAARSLTGLDASAVADGEIKALQNDSAFALTLTHDATSTAANRFYLPGNVDLVVPPKGAVVLRYDSALSRWQVWALSLDILQTTGRKTLSGGFAVTAYSAGTKSTGTFTPDPLDGNLQYATNGGAHILAAPASDCAINILYTNNGSAGAITFSGFTVSANVGDTLTTTDTHKFLIQIVRINSVATYVVKALQ